MNEWELKEVEKEKEKEKDPLMPSKPNILIAIIVGTRMCTAVI